MNLNELRDAPPGSRLASKRLGRAAHRVRQGGQDFGQGREGTEGAGRRGAERLRGRPVADLPPAAQARVLEPVPHLRRYAPINLGALARAIEAGKLDAAQPITEATLRAAGLVSGRKVAGVRLLAEGEIGRAITITVSGASAAARAAVEQAGGSVTTTVAVTAEAAVA